MLCMSQSSSVRPWRTGAGEPMVEQDFLCTYFMYTKGLVFLLL